MAVETATAPVSPTCQHHLSQAQARSTYRCPGQQGAPSRPHSHPPASPTISHHQQTQPMRSISPEEYLFNIYVICTLVCGVWPTAATDSYQSP
jgi:hypothetical protein